MHDLSISSFKCSINIRLKPISNETGKQNQKQDPPMQKDPFGNRQTWAGDGI
jgi:hypothetical protein